MKKKLKETLIYFLSRHRNFLLIRILARMASAFVKGVENFSFNFNLNGEKRVLEALSPFNLKTVFDVGANEGHWTLIAIDFFPSAEFHCFELAPSTYKNLERKFLNHLQVRTNQFGLADETKSIEFKLGVDSSTHSTLLEETFSDGNYRTEKGSVRKGDEYLDENDIDEIDFLKIDVEGSEGLVLEGFQASIRQGRIKVIQFEYGQGNKISHFLLRDFYALLETNGYVLGKIFPERVEFSQYSLEKENFIGPNHIAVKKDQIEIIEALKN